MTSSGEGVNQVQLGPTETPYNIEDLRIPPVVVEDLVLRRTLLDGRTSILRLSEALALTVSLMERVVEDMRGRQLLEVQGSEGRNLVLTLSDLGKAQANERMLLCRYVGPTPVSLEDYTRVVLSQTQRSEVNEASLREAFSDLVVDGALLDELGPAIRSKGAMFLYGPPGTGKSAIAERLAASTMTSCSCPLLSRSTARSSRCSIPVPTSPSIPSPASWTPGGSHAGARRSSSVAN